MVAVIGTVLAVFGTTWLVLNVLAPQDPSDPLARQGGLKPQQEIRRALPPVAPPGKEKVEGQR